MSTSSPNSPASLAARVAGGLIPLRRVWGMLILCSVLSFTLLVLLAGVYQSLGSASPVSDSAAW